MDWDTFTQLTLNGLTAGSTYALIALGYTLVYGVLKLLNFAHGDVFMVGSFIGYGVLKVLGGASDPAVPVWLLLTLMVLGSMVGCAVLGVAIERFAYRPLRDAPRIAPLISALGVSFLLASSFQLMFGAQQYDYGIFSLDGGSLYTKGFDIGNVHVPLIRIITILSAFALMVVLWMLVTRTRTGKAMRATSFDREAAAMMGIDIDRVIVFTFVIGSALAGAAGVMFALRVPTAASIGFVIGLKGFTAAVIGGIGSIPGAMAGGLILGFAEAYTAGLLDDALVRSRHLLAADRLHGVPADAACSDRRGSRRYERDPHPTTPRGARRPRDRQDEWVARHGERRSKRAGLHRRDRGAPAAGAVVGLARASSARPSRCCPLVAHSSYVQRVAFDTVLYMLLALGLNVVVGWGGLLDLGYVAFYGIGAYSYALLSSDKLGIHLPTVIAVPLVVVIGARRGLPRRASVAPARRRLPGDRDALLPVPVPDRGDERRSALRATTSRAAPTASSTSIRFEIFGQTLAVEHEGAFAVAYLYVALAFFAVVYLALHFVNDSRTGRAWRSLREDPLAAEAMGMPVNLLKLMAFSFGAAVAALTGTLFASLNASVFPLTFSFPLLITVYTMVILGGQGNIAGRHRRRGDRERAARVAARCGAMRASCSTRSSSLALVFAFGRTPKLAIVLGGTIVFGFIAHAVAGAINETGSSGDTHERAELTRSRTGSSFPSTSPLGRAGHLHRPHLPRARRSRSCRDGGASSRSSRRSTSPRSCGRTSCSPSPTRRATSCSAPC